MHLQLRPRRTLETCTYLASTSTCAVHVPCTRSYAEADQSVRCAVPVAESDVADPEALRIRQDTHYINNKLLPNATRVNGTGLWVEASGSSVRLCDQGQADFRLAV